MPIFVGLAPVGISNWTATSDIVIGLVSSHAAQPLPLECFVQPDQIDSVKPWRISLRWQQTRETVPKNEGNWSSLLRMDRMTHPQNPAQNPAQNQTQHLAAQTWENAEALIEHFEQALRAPSISDSLLDEIVTRLRTTANAQSVSLALIKESTSETLVRSGIAIADHSQISDQNLLSANRQVLPGTALQLDLIFENPLAFAIRQPLKELSEALLDFATNIFVRSELVALAKSQSIRDDHDRWIESLYRGVSLHDSFASIAGAIASRCAVDRVSLLRTDNHRAALIACSTQPLIDRRASQVRLLEQTVAQANTAIDSSTYLQTYLDRSGSKQVHIENVPDADVTIVLERYNDFEQDETLATSIDPIRVAVQTAVTVAIRRSQTDWSQVFTEMSNSLRKSNAALFAIAAALLILAASFVHVPLNLPVDGKVVAVKSQRIYAPTEGIVDDVLVSDGDTVAAGTELVRLRSPKLDLHQRAIEGTLATARTRLDALSVGRGEREPTHSADTKVLKTEIAGLEAQLRLIEKQQADLVVKSPIDGRVDRWDLESSLIARPVAVGQFLLNVVSETDGWTVQLNVPDQNVGYLIEHQQTDRCSVKFRLRSDATVVGESTIEYIADSTHVDASGNSVVLATMPFPTDAGLSVRDGATVLAEVNCGRRAIGFVWFRGIVEWWRSSSWF